MATANVDERVETGRPATAGAARTTGTLAQFVTGTRFEDLPDAVVRATKRLILDEIVVTAAAFDTPMARALLKLKADRGGTPEATLIVDGRRIPAASAAYVHAQLANLLDADETMHNRMHTLSASVMAGLAVAEMIGSSGRELIAAVATGYDITARIGISLRQYVPDGKGGLLFAPLIGWSWMTLGAAATAGRLIGLDAPAIARALGQAFVTAPIYFDVPKNNLRLVTSEHKASWHKYQMSGAMSEAGVNAALLTSFGWVAQDDLFDEGSDFWRSFAVAGCDWDVVYDGLGSRFYIEECSIKPYPFCRFGHATLGVFSDLLAQHRLTAECIEDVLVRIVPHELSETLASTAEANEPLKLMVSQPTAMALLAMDIPAGPKWFSADLTAPEIRGLADKIRYEVVPEWGAPLLDQLKTRGFFGHLPTEVIVRTKAGAEHRGSANFAQGDPWSAAHAPSDESVAAKAFQYLDGIMSRDRVQALIDAVLGLDRAKDVAAIVRTFG